MSDLEFFRRMIEDTAYLNIDRVSEKQYVVCLEATGYVMLATGWEEVIKSGKIPKYVPESIGFPYQFYYLSGQNEDIKHRLHDFIEHWAYNQAGLNNFQKTYFDAMNKLAVAWCLYRLHDYPKIPGVKNAVTEKS